MNKTIAVARREFLAFFQTPVGYIAVGLYSVLVGLGFTMSILMYSKYSQAPGQYGYGTVPDFEEWMLSPFLVYCGLLLMFLAPLITMRLLADERHRGTIELLFTFPLRDRDIVLGKFLAAAAMVGVMMVPVAVDLAVVGWLTDVEFPVLALGLAAAFLLGLCFVSLGLFVSAVTQNQVTAGFVTLGASLLLYVVGSLGERMPKAYPLPDTWPESLRTMGDGLYASLRGLVNELSIDQHAENMSQGIFEPQDPVFYILFTAFFLFLTFRALESRNWRA